MGPRIIDSHDSIGSGGDCNIESAATASGIFQRKSQMSMRESSSSLLSPSALLVESSSDDTHNSYPAAAHKELMASESQTSLGGFDAGGSNHVSFGAAVCKQTPYFSFSEWRPRLLLAWSIHFASCIIISWYGSNANNGKRKYIPIDVSTVEDECEKGFIDVFSSSMENEGAFVCCRKQMDATIGNPHICNPPPSYLPFARRLARFPDAWLLPLFPLLVRGAWQLYCNLTGKTSSLSKLDSVYSRRRLYLYLGLIQIRGWILYLAFDELEDLFVQSAGTQCWYEQYLHSNYHHCQGRMMDFSDHVVLYFAQILPIALLEILHSFSRPYWLTDGRPTSRRSNVHDNKGALVVPIVLLLWLANLYIVTFLGAFKTAAYFHTGPEVFVGFLVSLLVQVPLCLLQCSPALSSWREYFFGSTIP